MRRTQDDVMARTEAERWVGEEIESTGILIEGETFNPAEAGRALLNQIAKTVEYERGTSKDPDRNAVPMKRLVITTDWIVDPDAIQK